MGKIQTKKTAKNAKIQRKKSAKLAKIQTNNLKRAVLGQKKSLDEVRRDFL
jgi:hypothetical protein